MRKLPTYPMLLAVMLMCIMAKVGYASVLDRRVLEDGVYADTYYVYDLYDNLTVVIPPEGSAMMAGVGVWSASSSALSDYCYLYYFDRLHRMVGKKLPGCDRSEMKYTTTSQPVVWRDGNLRAAGRWQFLITDIPGREVITGTCSSCAITSPMVFAVPSGYTVKPMPEMQDIVSHISLCGYDVYGLELGDPEVLTVSYYDDYSFTDFDFVAGGDSLSFRVGSRPVELYPSARGMLTGRLTAVPVSTSSDSLEYLASAYYYDYRGRTVQSVEANRLGGYDRTTTGYDYVGNPIFTELTHSTAADPTGIRQQWERDYDSQGRELTVRHRLGDAQWTTLSSKEYDTVGRLQSETAGITSSYAYDIRSRQTSITSDRYGQWLSFTSGGNVSRMKWHTNVPGDVERSYAYSYDGLSRLTAADYYDATGKHGLYNTWYDYDLNGNVTSLTRRGITEVGVGVKKEGVIDRLTYEYQGNQVRRITDDAPELTYFNALHFVDGADEDVEYAYDANGNTVSDLNRGIGRITYDVNNRQRSVSFNNGGLTHYIYDAQGRKLCTEHRVPSLQPTLPGVIGAEQSLEITTTDYCGQFIYEDGVLDRINLAGGYINLSGTATPEYHYFQRDHLGNNRTDLISGGKVCQVNHYYPYGMNMYTGPLTNIQRWKFGGKELDRVNGLDLYDFEARAYDPATIRMWRPDDLSEKYYPISPFAYCANNPLILTDPTGNEVYLYATKLPGAPEILSMATHTFIVVTNEDNSIRAYYAYGATNDGVPAAVGLGGALKRSGYTQDKNVFKGIDDESLKTSIKIPVPEGMTQKELDDKVIDVAESYGNNPEIVYRGLPIELTEGNCNTSTSTILLNSGVSKTEIDNIKKQIPGISWGFSSSPKPWTAEEQKQAVALKRIYDKYKLTD